jgi:hypothetical protein
MEYLSCGPLTGWPLPWIYSKPHADLLRLRKVQSVRRVPENVAVCGVSPALQNEI